MALDESSACPFGRPFPPKSGIPPPCQRANAFRLRDSMAGLDYELRFSNHDYCLESAHPFPHNPPSLATLHGLSFSGWAQVCCRFGIFTHVLVLSRGPSPVPYLCITNIGSHTLLDPSNILSVGHNKKFLLLTALMAPLGPKIPSSVVECRSTGRLRVDWEYQPCYGAFTGPSTMISTKDLVLPVSECLNQYGAANGE